MFLWPLLSSFTSTCDQHINSLVNHYCRRSIMGNFHFISPGVSKLERQDARGDGDEESQRVHPGPGLPRPLHGLQHDGQHPADHPRLGRQPRLGRGVGLRRG